MMASSDVREWAHSFTADQGTLAEIVKGIHQELETLKKSIDIVENGFQIENATGLSLDALGALLDYKREKDLSDSDYRNQLLTLVEDSTTQTKEVIRDTVEWITGYSPTVEEPDIATVRVRLPLNKIQHAADVYAQLNRVKAAGIRIIVGHLEEFFESFSETLLVTDYIFTLMRGMFYDTFVEPWPLIGGSGQWDWGNWDASGALWDSSDEPSDKLFIWWTQELFEAYSDINWDDVLFFIGLLSLTDTFGTYSDALFFDGVLYETETLLAATLVDDLDYSGDLFLTESLGAGQLDGDLYFEGIYYLTETLLASALVELLTIGPWFEEDWNPLGWDLGEWDQDKWDQGIAADVLEFICIYDMTESYPDTNWDEDLYFEGILYGTESYVSGNLVDDLYFEGILYETEDLLASALVDSIEVIVPFMSFNEPKSNKAYATIGSAKVGGTNNMVIGFYTNYASNTLTIREAMK